MRKAFADIIISMSASELSSSLKEKVLPSAPDIISMVNMSMKKKIDGLTCYGKVDESGFHIRQMLADEDSAGGEIIYKGIFEAQDGQTLVRMEIINTRVDDKKMLGGMLLGLGIPVGVILLIVLTITGAAGTWSFLPGLIVILIALAIGLPLYKSRDKYELKKYTEGFAGWMGGEIILFAQQTAGIAPGRSGKSLFAEQKDEQQ